MAACNQAKSRAEDELNSLVLPAGMLDRVFSLLPLRDLKTGHVCRRWRQDGELQRNWVRILLLVFSLLPPRDLKAVVQVCRRWRQVGETPRLWSWAKIWVNSENMAVMRDILGSRRLQCVRELIVSTCSQITEEVVKARVGKKNENINYLDLILSFTEFLTGCLFVSRVFLINQYDLFYYY